MQQTLDKRLIVQEWQVFGPLAAVDWLISNYSTPRIIRLQAQPRCLETF